MEEGMDTCFLCEVGSRNQMQTGRPGVKEGFGTCATCNVHACARHGDRAPSNFQCADCVSSPAGSGGPPIPGGQVDTQDPARLADYLFNRLSNMGASGLIGLVPGLAIPARFLVTPNSGRQVQSVLNDMLAWARGGGPGNAIPLREIFTAMLDEISDEQLGGTFGFSEVSPDQDP